MRKEHVEIRDPIHGVITVSPRERVIIDSRAVSRLRSIKQVGFADFAFPSATHSRFSHSIGAMWVASKIFERVVPKETMSEEEWLRLHQAVRLAALLHEIGHPPLSHTTEMLMPTRGELFGDNDARKASHEDYTKLLIENSELSKILEQQFSDVGILPTMISDLLQQKSSNQFFVINGIDYAPMLRQIISSEMDCDRMDYLLRDSFFCGVNYGKFDLAWLMDNLVGLTVDKEMFLGLRARAIFAFEDFLLSRYHMFLSVYFHHTPVVMEKMLERYFNECGEFSLPKCAERYLDLDDGDLWHVLKKSQNQYAKRIISCTPYVVVHEHIGGKNPEDFSEDLAAMVKALKDANIDVIAHRSFSSLSTYIGKEKSPLFVLQSSDKMVKLEDFTPLFNRYGNAAELSRIFVRPEDKINAMNFIAREAT